MCLNISGDFLLCSTFIAWIFPRECTGCPSADCTFHGLVNHLPSDHLLNLLIIFNIFAVLCLLGFIQMVADKVIGNFASAWQEQGGNEMSASETASMIFSSAKRIVMGFTHQEREDQTTDDEANAPSNSWWSWWWWWPNSNAQDSAPSVAIRDEGDQTDLKRILGVTILVTKLTSTFFGWIISYAVFSLTQVPSIALEFSYRLVASFISQ